MKKRFMMVALVSGLVAAVSLPSCIGSFALSNKLLAWNKTIDNKFVNEAVFFAFWILPVYEVSILADALVLNSIEFWCGESPIAQSKSIIEGNDSKYLVARDSKGYTITSLTDNRSIRLDYDVASKTWSVMDKNGKEYPLMTFVDDSHIKVSKGNGEMMLIEKSESGLMALQQAVAGSFFAAN